MLHQICPNLKRKDEQEDAELRQLTTEAEVVNIGRGGMSVECSKKLREKKVYTARIFLCSSVFHVTCRVIWTLDYGSGHRFRSGVKFMQMNPEAVDDLASYLKESTTDLGKKLRLRMNATKTRVLFNEV